MRRRTFLIHTAATAALFGGCSSAHSFPSNDDAGGRASDDAAGDAASDGGLPDAAPSVHDGGPLFADASSFRDAALGGALVVSAPFRVLLNDTTCSHNGHTCFVEPGSWDDDVEISFLGGSHELRFRVSELMQLEAGERIPFATTGAGPGHGHCGMAWREEVGPFDDTRADVCTPRGTAACELPRGA